MLIRLAGRDADMGFIPELLETVARAEEVFPAPEFAVMFSNGESEDDEDELIIARRYDGVLVPMAYVPLEEIEGYDADGTDWLGDLAIELARTQAEIDAEEAVEQAAEEAGMS